jgi:SAM-dependent methyltransferase
MDWDFRGESTRAYYPHNICWYPARFVPQIPMQFIAALSEPGDIVYDPFCGCGTTLVETLRLGRKAVATDISPVATFLTRVKAQIIAGEKVNVQVLRDISDVVSERLFHLRKTGSDRHFHKDLEELKQWYHPVTLGELFSIKSAIDSLGKDLTANIAKVAFLAIVMSASGLPTDRPYTYYADNVKPKSSLLQKDAYGLFRSRLLRTIAGQEKVPLLASEEVHWFCLTRDILQILPSEIGSIDLIVTSPPYLGVTDYITGFRLAHLWFDFDCDVAILKHNEIGARWKRKHSNGLSDYLNNMKKSIQIMVDCLKEGGHICLVLGEAKKYSETVLQALSDHMTKVLGLTIISVLRRNVNQNFFIHPSGGVATEDIIIFRK